MSGKSHIGRGMVGRLVCKEEYMLEGSGEDDLVLVEWRRPGASEMQQEEQLLE